MSDFDFQVQHQTFERKRLLLASLIRVAQDVVGHTHSLQDVLLLARPSQTYPAKVEKYKLEVKKSLFFMEEPELKLRSDKYDAQCSLLLDALLEFVELTQLQIEDEKVPDEFTDDVRSQFDEFKIVTRTAIVIRLLLQELGLQLSPVKFSFPQEWIGEHIASLNETNHHIRLQAIDKVAELILDAENMLANPELPDTTRQGLEYVQHAMKANLAFLEHGGNIEKLPYEFESLEITHIPPETLHDYLDKERQKQEVQATLDQEAHQQKMKFNQKLKLWLNTPWETRWRDLD